MYESDVAYLEFLSKFRSVFNKGSGATTAVHRLLNLKQGKRSMADYSVNIWILAEDTGWGQEALESTLLNNICVELKYEQVTRDVPASLGAFISPCIKVDDCL